ncbi:MAG: hypothetical protein QXW39_04990 [Candidatus Bathyarchaeia archaeon]
MGSILKVDLTIGALRNEAISEDVTRKYLGGKVRDELIYHQWKKFKDLRGEVELKDQDVIAIFPPLADG